MGIAGIGIKRLTCSGPLIGIDVHSGPAAECSVGMDPVSGRVNRFNSIRTVIQIGS